MRLLFVQFLTKAVFLLFFITNLVGCDSQTHAEHKVIQSIDKTLCQFHREVCNQDVNDLVVGLMINPVFAPSEKPLQIKLHFSAPVSDVQMRIEGRDMFMGVIPVNLQSVDEVNYTGTGIYGSCSSDYMVWRAFVSYSYQGQTQSTWFDFLADNSG